MVRKLGSLGEWSQQTYPFATIGSYQASDGPLMVSASNLRQQRRLWLALGRPDLVKQNNRERIRDFTTEFDALTQAFQARTTAQWETLLREHQVPVSRVQRMEAMLADEHNQGRPVLLRFGDAAVDLSALAVPVAGFRLSNAPVAVTSPPQLPGAQNTELLMQLGYSALEIEKFKISGVV